MFYFIRMKNPIDLWICPYVFLVHGKAYVLVLVVFLLLKMEREGWADAFHPQIYLLHPRNLIRRR